MSDIRYCEAPGCGKPLKKRGDEVNGHFRRRRFCDRRCVGKGKRQRRKERGHVRLYNPGSGGMKLCVTCGDLPHRVPGGPGCKCPKCGTEFAEDRVSWEGSLLRSSAGALSGNF